MAETENTTETIRQLAALVVDHGLAELTVEEDGFSITIKGPVSAETSMMLPMAMHAIAAETASHPTAAPAVPPTAQTPTRGAHLVPLESPMVGLFYHSPAPGDPPFINIGDHVRVGQTIGLIEAMKVYSEVPAEAAGRVVEIATSNGVLVQQGQPLYFIEQL